MLKWSTSISIYFTFYIMCISIASGSLLNEKIYVKIRAIAACYRLLNATHQIGCSSSRSGNVGILHHVNTTSELDWLMSTGPNDPYVALMTADTFTQPNIERLRESGKVNGILVYYDNHTTSPAFSPASTCPNSGYGFYRSNNDYKNCRAFPWNPTGNRLLLQDIGFPIMALTDWPEVQSLIEDCYERFNKPIGYEARPYPLCAVEVTDAMDAAKDTPTCLRRSHMVTNLNPQRYCDPLGNNNVHALLHAINSSDTLNNNSVIIAATKLDARSLFLGLTPAADSTVGGLVTLLATAQALATVIHRIRPSDKHIMFAFFNGETFDYIGSSRMVYEMKRSNFPAERSDPVDFVANEPHLIRLNHISSVVEVGQVALQSEQMVWMHADPVSTGNDPSIRQSVNQMKTVLKNLALRSGLNISSAPYDQPLPPASIQSFLMERELPGIVITEHKREFVNRNYQGRFDTAESLHDSLAGVASRLQPLATTLARSLYKMSTGRDDADALIVADSDLIRQLLHCFLQSAQCELFNKTLDEKAAQILRKSLIRQLLHCFLQSAQCELFNKTLDEKAAQILSHLADAPLPLYVGVSHSFIDESNLATVVVHHLLASFLGEQVVNETAASCKELKHPLYKFVWMQGSVNESGSCIKTTTNYSSATSPAFDIDDYDWSSNRYSSWTESAWEDEDSMAVRMFLLPDRRKEINTFIGGVIMFVLCLVLVYFLNKHIDFWFTTNTSQTTLDVPANSAISPPTR